jgi:superfamily II DNA or RNA helicase
MSKYIPDLDQITTISYTRKDGLADGALIAVNNHLFDTTGRYEKGGERTGFDDISALGHEAEVRAAIKTSLETSAAEEILNASLRKFDEIKKDYPRTKCLVVTKDIATASSTHRLLKKKGRRAELATSDDSLLAKRAVREFKFGQGDILVTCQMCYEGLDCKAISVISLLTHIRTKPWIEQAIARGTRWDPQGPSRQTCHLFTLNDVKMQEVLARIKSEDLEAARETVEAVVISGETNGLGNYNPVVPLSSSVQGFHWTDLDSGADLSVETFMAAVNEVIGSAITIEQASALADRLYAQPKVIEERPLTPKEISNQYRKQIEKCVRRMAVATNSDPEQINRQLKREAGKSRRHMTNSELLAVLNAVTKWEKGLSATNKLNPSSNWTDFIDWDEEEDNDSPF